MSSHRLKDAFFISFICSRFIVLDEHFFQELKKSILMFALDGRLATPQKNIEKPDLPAVVSYAL